MVLESFFLKIEPNTGSLMKSILIKTHQSHFVLWFFCLLLVFLSLTPIAMANVDVPTDHKYDLAKAQQSNIPLTIGILAFREKNSSRIQRQPLIDYLNQSLPNIHINLQMFTFIELQKAVENQKIDFVLTNSANYIQLTHKFKLSAPLASLINDVNGIPILKFGGAILTLDENAAVHQLKDLKTLRIATPSRQSLGGYMMQAYELKRHGFNPQIQRVSA
jgi:ABC-type phosphate/phosphonate transport system substrate-binding protein